MNDQQLEAAGSGGGRQRCRREFRTRVSTVWYILLLCLLFKWKSHPDVGMYWRKKKKRSISELENHGIHFLAFSSTDVFVFEWNPNGPRATVHIACRISCYCCDTSGTAFHFTTVPLHCFQLFSAHRRFRSQFCNSLATERA